MRGPERYIFAARKVLVLDSEGFLYKKFGVLGSDDVEIWGLGLGHPCGDAVPEPAVTTAELSAIPDRQQSCREEPIAGSIEGKLVVLTP